MCRRILVASVGMSPAVVTETLWALMNPEKQRDETVRGMERFVPERVHVVTTTFGRTLMEKKKLQERIEELYAQMGEQPPQLCIDVPRADGQEIRDINTERENAAFADFITELIRRYTSDEQVCLHVSLAGGRKTMTSFTHAAMTYFGRPQDRLTHVLIEPPELERCAEFWWPGQKDTDLFTSAGHPVSAREEDVHVALVETPYVRLRPLIDMEELPEPISHSDLVDVLQRAVMAETLELHFADRTVRMGEHVVKLSPREFALYVTLAQARKHNWPGAGPDGIGPRHRGWLTFDLLSDPHGPAVWEYLGNYQEALRGDGKAINDIETWKQELRSNSGGTVATRRNKIDSDAQTDRSRINNKIMSRSDIPRMVRERMKIHFLRRKTKKQWSEARFGLLREPHQFHIVRDG